MARATTDCTTKLVSLGQTHFSRKALSIRDDKRNSSQAQLGTDTTNLAMDVDWGQGKSGTGTGIFRDRDGDEDARGPVYECMQVKQ